MLALTTAESITLLDLASLKRGPSSIPSCQTLISRPTASAWSTDNTTLLLSSSRTIHRYEPHSNNLVDVHSIPDEESPISGLLARDKSTLIYSSGTQVHVLELGTGTGKVRQTLESHKTSITSLSLSHDATLLACTSIGGAHVYNLSLGTHTVLRVPLNGQSITTCTFHPHLRTRLLIGAGKQLVVYDTTRPSSPLRSIAMSSTASGEINAVACSPFSKTLVAVSTTGGSVGLVDLDKEKGLFRTIDVKVPGTSITFSPEGASIYVGTENGKLLVLDLRSLDQPPKTIVVSDIGSRIETLSVHRKIKSTPEPSTKSSTATTTTAKASPPQDLLSARHTIAPMSTQVNTNPRSAPQVTRTRQSPNKAEKIKPAVPLPISEPKKKVFSPVRDPLGNSAGSGRDLTAQLESLPSLKEAAKKAASQGKKPEPKPRSPKPIKSPSARKADIASKLSARSSRLVASGDGVTETASARPRTVPISRTESSSSRSRAASSTLSVPGEAGRVMGRQRTASSASRAGSSKLGTLEVADSRPGSSTSNRSPSPTSTSSARRTAAAAESTSARTPSPELPKLDEDVISAAGPAKPKNGRGIEVLGLSTPDVDRWIRAKKGEEKENANAKAKAKVVGFAEPSGGKSKRKVHERGDRRRTREQDSEDESELENERSLTLHVSPMRRTATARAPVRHMPSTSSVSASLPSSSAAHDLLRTIVSDVVADMRAETRAEMTGLHLDLVRMGRGWRRELRTVMDEYVGDLRDLRAENGRLREENERLRRGF